MRQSRIEILFLLILTFLFSCVESGENFVVGQMPIEIYQSAFPETGTLDQGIAIQLRARAENECFSDLEIQLVEVDSKHFLFKATGMFDSRGACADIMVYKDTTITFKPTTGGKYFFQVNEEPFEVKKDTVDIN